MKGLHFLSNSLRQPRVTPFPVTCLLFFIFSMVCLSMRPKNNIWDQISEKTTTIINSEIVRRLQNQLPYKIPPRLRETEISDVISHLDPPSNLPYNITTSIKIKDAFIRTIVLKYLSTQERGFFIEAGALDGQLGSNTLWLELKKNWTGLLLEPNPTSYQHLRLRHRKAWSSNTCISDSKYSSSITLEVPYIPQESQLNWLFLSNSRVIHSPFHTYNDVIRKQAEFYNVTVQCYPLQSYLKALKVTTVDFLSLDIQGGEKEVLLNFPHDQILIRYIIVEYFNFAGNRNNPRKIDLHFVSEMRKRRFKLLTLNKSTFDYVFVNLSV